MKQDYFTRHCPPEYPPAPCPLAAGTGRTRPPARSRRPMPARAAATAAGAGSASMKKSKPEPIPVMDYRQYRQARRLVHECCNYDGGNCIALDDGEECVCVQPFPTPCVPVVPGGGAAAGQRTGNGAVPPPGRQAVRRLRGAVHPRLQPGQILPGMCRTHEAYQGRPAQAETKGEMSRFRGRKPLVNQGFFEGVAGGLIDLSSGPPNGPLKAYRPLK